MRDQGRSGQDQGGFSGEISPDLSESDQCDSVPPKSGLCSEASTGDTSPKKKPWSGPP